MKDGTASVFDTAHALVWIIVFRQQVLATQHSEYPGLDHKNAELTENTHQEPVTSYSAVLPVVAVKKYTE